MSVPGISKIMYCWILIDMPYWSTHIYEKCLYETGLKSLYTRVKLFFSARKYTKIRINKTPVV